MTSCQLKYFKSIASASLGNRMLSNCRQSSVVESSVVGCYRIVGCRL